MFKLIQAVSLVFVIVFFGTSCGSSISPDVTTLISLWSLPDKPFVMLNLMEYTDEDGATYGKYGANTLPYLTNVGGKILYSGAPVDVPGSDGWQNIALVYYPSPSAFFEMVTDSGYQAGIPHRDEGLKRTVVYAFSTTDDSPPLQEISPGDANEIWVLNLMRYKADGGRDEYQKYSDVVLPMVMERGGRPVMALKSLLPVVSEESWEDLYLVYYPNLESLTEMVGTETWEKANVDRERGLDLTWAFPTRPQQPPAE